MKTVRFLIVSALLLAGLATTSRAQQVRPVSADRIYHEIAQLKNLTHVLYLAAHPDDENTRLLAWLVNIRHIPTAYLSLTRGDGGQNILGSEQGAPLGLIRTHELMEARKLDGAQQFFTRAIDFGFSKNYNETFRHWNEQQLLEDVVHVIQQYRPDIIICRFPPNAAAGHGHHAASAVLGAEAFRVTGNAQRYGTKAWQPKRILFNAYRFGDNNTIKEDQFRLDVGQYTPSLGMGVGELAGLSRSIHKSQGAGTPGIAGVQSESFALVDGAALSRSLFDGIDTTWNRAGHPELTAKIDRILAAYNFNAPEQSLPALLQLRREIQKVQDDFWRNEKLRDLDAVILHCSGFMGEAVTDQPEATPASSLKLKVNLIARSGALPFVVRSVNGQVAIGISAVSLSADDIPFQNDTLRNDLLATRSYTLRLPADMPVSQPYWLSAPPDHDFYSIPDKQYLGLPVAPSPLNLAVAVQLGNTDTLLVSLPVSFKKLDPLKGDVVEALRIVPPVTLAFSNNQYFAENGSVNITLRVHAHRRMENMSIALFNERKERLVTTVPLSLPSGQDTMLHFTLPAGNATDLSAVAEAAGQSFDKTQHLIQYSHLPTLQYFTPATARIIPNNWKCTARRIGYIQGAGDYIPTLLQACGLQVDILKEADLTSAASLKSYDAIITGVRAVNVEKRMSYWLPVLFEYVRNGGTLVMQYNTLQELSTSNIGPYPIKLGRGRVTEEDATVTFPEPQSRLLNYPNKITDTDFTGWVQERGVNFPSEWDQHYQALLAMHDEGEDILKGALLYAPYGKGHYIYTALSLFRQLPAGNTGAIRLLMNMISVGK